MAVVVTGSVVIVGVVGLEVVAGSVVVTAEVAELAAEVAAPVEVEDATLVVDEGEAPPPQPAAARAPTRSSIESWRIMTPQKGTRIGARLHQAYAASRREASSG